MSKKELRERRNVQNAIQYDMMIKNGICILPDDMYSASMRFKDINYQIAPEEEQQSIFSRYMDILNSLGQEYGVQLTVNNRKIDEEEFEKESFLEYQGEDLDVYRKEFNDLLKNKISSGNNKIISEKMITYTVKEDSYKEAKKTLDILNSEFINKFDELGCDAEMMNGYDRLETIYSIFNPDKKFCFSYDNLDKTYTTKDAISPDSLDFKVDGAGAFRVNGRFAKVMYLKDWSTELSDQLIQSLTRLEHNLTIAFHMRVIPRGEDLALVKNQIAKMEMQKMDEQKKALNQMYDPDMLPMDLKYSLEEGYALKDDVERRNQRLFECQFLVMINASSLNEQKETQKAIETACKKLGCQMGVLDYRQEEGMNAILPIGRAVKKLARTLPTSVCGILMPFTSQELMQKGNSVYYGINPITSNVIMGNRKTLINYGGWILGASGSGKSMAAKSEISWSRFATNDVITIIDPQGEYAALAKKYHGSIINVDTKSGVHFNPFDGDIKERNFVKEKGEFAQIMMAEIMGEGKLSPEQKSIVDVTVRRMYEKYLKRLEDTENGLKVEMPTLDDFYAILKERKESLAQDMALTLEMYISGGTYDLFAGQNNVDLNNRFTVYNILELPETLRPLAMKVILETLRSTIIANFRKNLFTRVYIDEIYLLLKDEYSENFLYEFFKWARKFGGIPTGITQNVEDLLNSAKARTMIGNSEFLLLLNQSPSDREELASLLNLSRDQLNCISNSKRGSGLMKFGNTIIPFVNEFPKDTQLYALWNTDFGEKSTQRPI